MRICHVSPHLPPDQAANALLPAQLGRWMAARGDVVSYVAHEPRQGGVAGDGGRVTGDGKTGDGVHWIPRRAAPKTIARALRLDAWRVARQVNRALDTAAKGADVLHLHSNGLIIEVAAAWAARHKVPYVLTLYGTEIWHYEPRRFVDPFTRAYHGAGAVTFYSEGLLHHAREVGLDRRHMIVTYPPVGEAFAPRDEATRRAWHEALGIREPLVILNVKRLHTLAGHKYLIDAFARVTRGRTDVRLVICGTGALRESLEQQARIRGVEQTVTFAGLVDNEDIAHYMAVADVFVLPSLLEALPTVAVEALASGTPVISADHPGGVELAGIFGDDVAVVSRENVESLANAIAAFLRQPRRTYPGTADQITKRFRPLAVLANFEGVYRQVLGR